MNFNQLVHQNGERLFVTSLEISNHFDKKHKDVLRALQNLECSEEFRRRNFTPTVYHRPNPSGGASIPAPMVELTRDGFVFLCMGFTGAQAALWKERYITAFNQMEAALKQQQPRHELALAQEIGALRDQLARQGEMVLGLYAQLSGAQRGHLRAVTQLLNIEKRQAKRESKELVLALLAQGVPRDEIARRSGKTLNHIRQLAFQHKAELIVASGKASSDEEE